MMRIEIRLADTDPLAGLLQNLSGRQRTALVRAILTAALMPGGWAQMTQGGQLSGAALANAPSENSQAPAAAPQASNEPKDNSEVLTETKPVAGYNFLKDLLASDFVEQ